VATAVGKEPSKKHDGGRACGSTHPNKFSDDTAGTRIAPTLQKKRKTLFIPKKSLKNKSNCDDELKKSDKTNWIRSEGIWLLLSQKCLKLTSFNLHAL
jgi:hypothetical protein